MHYWSDRYFANRLTDLICKEQLCSTDDQPKNERNPSSEAAEELFRVESELKRSKNNTSHVFDASTTNANSGSSSSSSSSSNRKQEHQQRCLTSILSIDILSVIVRFLTFPDVQNMRLVCRRWNCRSIQNCWFLYISRRFMLKYHNLIWNQSQVVSEFFAPRTEKNKVLLLTRNQILQQAFNQYNHGWCEDLKYALLHDARLIRPFLRGRSFLDAIPALHSSMIILSCSALLSSCIASHIIMLVYHTMPLFTDTVREALSACWVGTLITINLSLVYSVGLVTCTMGALLYFFNHCNFELKELLLSLNAQRAAAAVIQTAAVLWADITALNFCMAFERGMIHALRNDGSDSEGAYWFKARQTTGIHLVCALLGTMCINEAVGRWLGVNSNTSTREQPQPFAGFGFTRPPRDPKPRYAFFHFMEDLHHHLALKCATTFLLTTLAEWWITYVQYRVYILFATASLSLAAIAIFYTELRGLAF